MLKKELIEKVAERTGKSQKEVAEILDGTLAVISDTIKAKEEVRIPDFGTFKHLVRKAQMRRNPHTGEMFMAEEKETVTFKPSAKFFFYAMTH